MHCRVSTMDIGLTEYRTLQNRMRAGKATARTCIIVSLIARGIVTYNLAKNCWGGDRSTASCLLWPLLQTLSLTKMEKSAKQGLFLSHTCGQGRECTSIFSPSLYWRIMAWFLYSQKIQKGLKTPDSLVYHLPEVGRALSPKKLHSTKHSQLPHTADGPP